jgi:mycofactocin precursor
MEQHTATLPPAAVAAGDDVETTEADATLVEEELLVEEISIDGMCGVY